MLNQSQLSVVMNNFFQIKYKNLSHEATDEVVLLGHEAPILSVGLDPLAEILISSSCDGTFRVWKLSTQEELHQGMIDSILVLSGKLVRESFGRHFLRGIIGDCSFFSSYYFIQKAQKTFCRLGINCSAHASHTDMT